MTNWTITEVKTERTNVIDFPIRKSPKRRLTTRGRVVVAVAYTVVTLTMGYVLAGLVGGAMDYEHNKAHTIGVQHSEMIKAKKAGAFYE